MAVDINITGSYKVNGVPIGGGGSFVPYTGATGDVDLGTHTLRAKNLIVNHPSGSGDAATITKGGAGEALKVVKTSGSGNAASITGGVTQLDELHLTTDLADSYISSAATWNAKQEQLVSGTNIKTINGSSVLGSGDLDAFALVPTQTVASAATVTPTSANQLVVITAQAVALTLAAPTGTLAQGQPLMIRIKDNGTARAITWTSGAGGYRAIGVTLPTTTVANKITYVGCIYNSTDSRWDVIGVTTEA
jgi:hypothetical protein